MGESHDFMSLEWVQNDIEQTLQQAQESLEACLVGEDREIHLQACYDAVHQVQGSLQMVGLSGAVLLTEQMESLLSTMLNGSVSNLDQAYTALAQALVHLPPYLTRVRTDVDESPILLLSAINDIRSVMGESLLPEFALFEPKLGAPRQVADEEIKSRFNSEGATNIRKMRQIYQFALIGLIRNEDAKVNVGRISNVIARLHQACKGAPINQLWEISSALMEGLISDAIELSNPVVDLLRGVDKEIKGLVEAGCKGLDRQPDAALLKGALFYIARTPAASPHIQAVKQEYDLDRYQLVTDNAQASGLIAGPDKETLNSVVTALTEELQRIKDTIDLYVRNEVKANIDLGGLQPSLRQISSTLVLLNLEAPRLVVQEQLDLLAEHSNGGAEIPSETLLQIAESLLYVEAELQSIAERSNSTKEDGMSAYAGSAKESVIVESLVNLKQAKEHIHEFVDGGDFEELEQVPLVLRGTYGGLSMLSMSTAGQLVFSVAQFVEDDILALSRVPEPERMDTLAEVLAAVELYLEGMEGERAVNESILEQAKQKIASMGYPIEQREGITSDQKWSGEEPQIEAEQSLELEIAEEDPFASALQIDVPEAEEPSQDQPQNQSDDLSEQFLELEVSDEEVGDGLNPEVAEQENEEAVEIIEFELPTEEENEVVPEQAVSEQASEAVLEPDQAEQIAEADSGSDEESLVDDEILEIFAEEAEEVFEAIDEHWPAFAGDHSNTDALTEVRRAFHTLKGSGRMVNAAVIGELAWSIEHLLNQVIEDTLTMNQSIAGLVDQVRNALPGLLVHFKEQTEPEIDVSVWMTQADRLAAGEQLTVVEVKADEVKADEVKADEVKADEVKADEVVSESDPLDSSEIQSEEPIVVSEQAEAELPEETVDVRGIAPVEQEPSEAVDRTLYQIFSKEAAAHLGVVGAFIESAEQSPGAVPFTDELYRALHTLKGSAHMASLDAIAQIATASECFVRELRNVDLVADDEVVALLREGKKLIETGVEQLSTDSDISADRAIEGSDQFLSIIQEQQTRLLEQIEKPVDEEIAQSSSIMQFLQGNIERVCELSDQFEQWQEQPTSDSALFDQLTDHIALLNEAAVESEQHEVQPLLATLEYVYRTVGGLRLSIEQDLVDALKIAHEGLVNLMDQMAAGQDLPSADEWVAGLDNALTSAQEQQSEKSIHSEQPDEEILPGEMVEVDSPREASVAEEPAEPAEEVSMESAPQVSDVDHELMDIFLGEADEIMEATADAKQRWIEDPTNLAAVDELQRGLHTLKGSSRMAGMGSIGDLSHELESIYEDVNNSRIAASPALFDLVHECDDRLADMVAEIRASFSCSPANQLIEKVRQFHALQLQQPDEPVAKESRTQETVVFDTALGATVEADAEQLQNFFKAVDKLLEKLVVEIKKTANKQTNAEKAHQKILEYVTQLQNQAYGASVHETGDLCQIFMEVITNLSPDELISEDAQTDLSEWLERITSSYQEAKSSAASGEVQPVVVEPQESAATPATERKQSKETVRVSSELLEQLVDLAGETSVSRSRVEQQVSNFGYAIDEMGSTVERLREQLRRMEIETEAQILFRQEREGPEHEGFDPLEMDRYSRMQELSRALVESVSDLFDLKDTLQDRSRYTENLLLQQSRINTELQEGLMKTRMVPFSRMVPRLRRIVRQVSNELGKQAELQLKNIETELDRTLLEHMTAPLEHMLRNALDHGIETPVQRAKAGKAEAGRIRLELARDGGDIVLTLTDDGAGIDVDSVREKAIERGLMGPGAELSDHEVLQFIMQAGFSTAKQVTQISGRGVGMDVVGSEIKQLGGSIEIDSTAGEGTRFTVRLPFTVSINRALMVTIGDEAYALPLSTIEGVVRVSPYELEEYYKSDGPDFEYAGQKYDLRYLGEYIGHDNSFKMQNYALPLPVVLIRTAEHAAAIQVDSVTGSREIVVKPLGSQLGVIPGMSGATILGDGRVVLILDMAAMIRSAAAVQSKETIVSRPAPVSENLQVMVVDDSVTVRKVASRLLERHSMDVIVAKDGVEAMTKLQDTVPDIMLLDIEMPRMDGFELASLMRHDERLSEVPIVMITSRTGDKHRERALGIGVNRFMGKPFQEKDLIEVITELTDYERSVSEA